MKNKPVGYEYPHIKDFSISLVSAVIFSGIQILFENKFYHFVMPYIKKCKTVKEQEFRAGKSAKYMFRFVYFSCAVFWGFKVLIN
jgi:hypothetical protein